MAIAAGQRHVFAQLEDGRVVAWGRGENGVFIARSRTNYNIPIEIDSFREHRGIVAGSNHACGIAPDSTVKCIGQNANGQFGVPPLDYWDFSIVVQNINTAAVGLSTKTDHTCATLNAGLVKCFGPNFKGQLGNGLPIEDIAANNYHPAREVFGVTTAVMVAVGIEHTCILLNDYRTVQCMGDNTFGQLGNSAAGDLSTVPVDVLELFPWH